ncbi:MAG: putative aminopeptidase [Cellvibrionaceae bacterium]|jgi:predicted aminopeptidase
MEYYFLYRVIRFSFIACGALLLLSSCTAVSYYTQSIVGHSSLMLSRKPIEKVLKGVDETLKQQLLTAVEIRQFATSELGLPDNQSYTSYVQLKNDPPIWNVIAAEEFSLRGKQWCYPVIGCAGYRGYYHREDADKYAKKIEEEGYEIHLSSATAYSTLGWFDDPLTSAMFKRGDASLAELVFHELAHQQLYVKGDSRFNEAFASAVGEQGAIRWLRMTNRNVMLDKYQQRQEVRDDFINLINEAKAKLKIIYGSKKTVDRKRKEKQKVFSNMRQKHESLIEKKWGGKKWYALWFSQPINNARLVAISTYRDLVPDFVGLFQRCGEDFSLFYGNVKRVSAEERRDLNVECSLL